MLQYTAAAGDPSNTASGIDDETAAAIEAAPVFLMCFSQKYEESAKCRRGNCSALVFLHYSSPDIVTIFDSSV